MNSYLRKVIEYTAGNFFSKFIYFLLIPILSRQLIPEDYAVYGNVTIFMSFASMVFLLGIQQALYSFFYDNSDRAYKFLLTSTVFITLAVTGLIFSSAIILNSDKLSYLITRSNLYSSIIPLVALTIFSDSLFGISLSFLNIQEKSTPYIVLGSLKNLLFLALIIIFSIGIHLTILRIFQILLFVSAVSLILAIMVMLKLQRENFKEIENPAYFSGTLIKSILKFGIIMVPGTLAMMVLRMSDRYMITWLSAGQLYDTGIYSIGYRIGLIMQFPVSMVSMVYFPYAMKIAQKKDAYENYGNAFRQFALLGGMLGIMLIMFSREMIYIFVDEAYTSSHLYVFAGVMSAYLLGLFNISNLTSYVEKKAGNIAIAVIIGSLFNIILNYFGIISFGIIGAAVSSVVSYLIIVLLNMYRLKKNGISVFRLPLPISVITVMSLCGYLNFILENSLTVMIIKVVLTLFMLIQLFRFELIKKYLDKFRKYIRKGSEKR